MALLCYLKSLLRMAALCRALLHTQRRVLSRWRPDADGPASIDGPRPHTCHSRTFLLHMIDDSDKY